MIQHLETQEFRNKLKEDSEGILLDVRMREEYDEDRICKSVQCDYMQLENFKAAIESFDQSRHYYVYCMTGHRSEEACALMNEMGFEFLVNLKGGMVRFDGKLCTDDDE